MLKKLVIFSFALVLFSVPQQVFAQSNVLILNIENFLPTQSWQKHDFSGSKEARSDQVSKR